MATSGTPTTYLVESDLSALEYSFKKGEGNRPNFIPLDQDLTIELGHPGLVGWHSAPFGLSAKFNEQSRKQQLQILMSNEHILGKLMELDARNKEALTKNTKKWFGKTNSFTYMPIIRTTEDGRTLAQFKVTPDGRGKTWIWKTADGSVYEKGTITDITPTNGYTFSFRARGIWIMPGNVCGMSLEVMEIAVHTNCPAPIDNDVDMAEPSAPSLNL